MRGEFRSLTAYRGIASLIIVVFHMKTVVLAPLFPAFHNSQSWQLWLGQGYLSVDFFFLLSGFILSYVYSEKLNEWDSGKYYRYLALRLGRIYPVHLATLFVMLACFGFLYSVGKISSPLWIYSYRDLVLNIVMMHGWDLTRDLTFNRPAWSVSAEWFAYLWFPLALPWVRRVRGAVVPALLALGAWVAMIGTLRLFNSTNLDRTYHLGVVRVGFEFLAGMLLYRSFLGLQKRTDLARVIFWISLVTLAGVWFFGKMDPFAVPLFGAILLSSAVIDESLTLLRWKPLQKLGAVSYSLYMVHHVVIRMGQEFVPAESLAGLPIALRMLVPLIYVAIFIALAAVTQFTIEEPCRKWVRDLSWWRISIEHLSE